MRHKEDTVDAFQARLEQLLSPRAIADHIMGELLPDLVMAALTLGLFYLAWRVVRRITQTVLTRAHLDATGTAFAQSVIKYALFAIGFVAALAQLGVDTSSLLTSLGVAGLTIGFAAKDALSNIISGLFIFWDRPFVIGDLVEVNGRYGRVTEITMRSTRVVTVDGKMLAIPNSEVANSTVASYTNFPHLRLDIDICIGVGEDIDRVRALLLALVAGDDRFMEAPAPVVVVLALNDYNVALQLRAWIVDERTHVEMSAWLREQAFKQLTRAEVEMPFETLNVLTAAPGVRAGAA
ncbi:MAG: mechanosensitive ion channel family protein [Deltaproteobacteria bacterium]|nr:mechanosensitive ion channel family protein [Deltaproteobacteria bacterium]MCB9786118.1 mechanosensitive ion channel family protein [Deltaproteobacteria bacterium]